LPRGFCDGCCWLSLGPVSAAVDKFSARFERLKNERRDHELIIFNLPIISSEVLILFLLLPLHWAYLSTLLRLYAHSGSSSLFIGLHPLLLDSIIAKRNELIVYVRRRRGLLPSDILSTWSFFRISLLERAIGPERRIFNEA